MPSINLARTVHTGRPQLRTCLGRGQQQCRGATAAETSGFLAELASTPPEPRAISMISGALRPNYQTRLRREWGISESLMLLSAPVLGVSRTNFFAMIASCR